MSNGYVRNCFVSKRDDDTPYLFKDTGEVAIAYLNGYAVIPLEQYREICPPEYLEGIDELLASARNEQRKEPQ